MVRLLEALIPLSVIGLTGFGAYKGVAAISRRASARARAHRPWLPAAHATLDGGWRVVVERGPEQRLVAIVPPGDEEHVDSSDLMSAMQDAELEAEVANRGRAT